MASPKAFGIVLAGGEGKRLMPLTADRAKPAVPFAGHYRLVDFAISNLINSGLRQVVVLTQYKSHSLDRHVSQMWRLSGMLNAYVASVPAQQRLGKRWFAGSADAIFQSLNLIRDEKPDLVVVVGADHVYRMDFQQMIDAHVASGAGVTVAGIRLPREHSDQFGVITTDAENPEKIRAFTEKPSDPEGLADSPDEILASMGNYVFTTSALINAVRADAKDVESDHDMGGDIIPAFVERGDANVYDLNRNTIPGARPNDRFYWRDVGTIDAFFDAHQDLISTDPIFNLFNTKWPIFSQQWNSPPAKFVKDENGNAGSLSESTVSLGCYVVGAQVVRSVLSPWVKIDSGALVEDSILFERVVIGAGAVIRRAILDKDVVVEPGAQVGVDETVDRARGFTLSPGGVTVVEKRNGRSGVSSTQLLIVLDVDSTLTQDEGIDLLARRVSPEVADRVAGITTRAMNGELDFAQSLIERVETLQGVTLEQVAHATSQVRLSVGAQLLIDTLHAHGHLVAAVSGGFHEMLDPLAASVGLDMHHANRFVTKNGVLTGKVAGPIVDASSKAATLRRWADEHGIAEHNTVAVGDGGNDVEMMVAAGMGISYMGKPVTKKAADRCIDVPDLSLVLQELGISRA